jgi:hypothetical protein
LLSESPARSKCANCSKIKSDQNTLSPDANTKIVGLKGKEPLRYLASHTRIEVRSCGILAPIAGSPAVRVGYASNLAGPPPAALPRVCCARVRQLVTTSLAEQEGLGDGAVAIQTHWSCSLIKPLQVIR